MIGSLSRHVVRFFPPPRFLSMAGVGLDISDTHIYFIELNTIPGMTSTSLAPEAAKAAGLEFNEFLDKLIEGAGKNNPIR